MGFGRMGWDGIPVIQEFGDGGNARFYWVFIFSCSFCVDLVVWIDSMDIVFLFHYGFAGHYCINY